MEGLTITRHDHGASGEYHAHVPGTDVVGRLTWFEEDGVKVADHTLVPPAIGNRGVAAKLVGSKFVNGNLQVLVKILTNGKEGSIGLMPPLGASMSDEELAGVLTFVRGSWGNTAPPVKPAAVKELRAMFAYRKVPWSEQELEAEEAKHSGHK